MRTLGSRAPAAINIRIANHARSLGRVAKGRIGILAVSGNSGLTEFYLGEYDELYMLDDSSQTSYSKVGQRLGKLTGHAYACVRVWLAGFRVVRRWM